MYSEIDFDRFLFFDMETVPEFESFDEFQEKNPRKAEAWLGKRSKAISDKYIEHRDSSENDKYWDKAAIFAEFNRIVTITLGTAGYKTKPHLITYYGTDEKAIIESAVKVIDKYVNPSSTPNNRLWGYYSNRFDVPLLYKHLLINNMTMPSAFYFHALKPWETQCKDVYDMWNVMMGERSGSLDMLTTLFNIPSPKEDIDGTMVKHIYYKDKNYYRIAKYCNHDVVATYNVLRYMSQLDIIPFENFTKNNILLNVQT